MNSIASLNSHVTLRSRPRAWPLRTRGSCVWLHATGHRRRLPATCTCTVGKGGGTEGVKRWRGTQHTGRQPQHAARVRSACTTAAYCVGECARSSHGNAYELALLTAAAALGARRLRDAVPVLGGGGGGMALEPSPEEATAAKHGQYVSHPNDRIHAALAMTSHTCNTWRVGGAYPRTRRQWCPSCH